MIVSGMALCELACYAMLCFALYCIGLREVKLSRVIALELMSYGIK